MFRTNTLWVCGSLVAVMLFSASCNLFAESGWSIEGEYFEGCTCNPGCPCLFGSEPTHNRTCKITGVFHINKGKYGQHNLDGKTVIGITDLTATPDKKRKRVRNICSQSQEIQAHIYHAHLNYPLCMVVPTTLVPPDTRRIMGLLSSGFMAERNTPLVTKSASLYSIIGLIVSPGFSRLFVGPRKYP
ncbi:MAG: DUF1326 domain-containing protein [Colwellia sp.]|nr:DUF1326 domain-containing protein [Colwellia sp.]